MLFRSADFGIVRIIVNDLDKATAVLQEAGYIHSVSPVVAVAIPDTPGGLNSILTVLSDAQVNVEYMYAFLGGKNTEHAYMIFRVEDPKAAAAALAAKNIQVVNQDEIAGL